MFFSSMYFIYLIRETYKCDVKFNFLFPLFRENLDLGFILESWAEKNAWNNCTDLSWKAVEDMLSKRLSDKLGLLAEFLPCVPVRCCGPEKRYDTQSGT